MSGGNEGPPRWMGMGGPRGGRPTSQSPFRGPPPPPRPGSSAGGWASPIPPRMTQSPPPFLIRPMVGGGPRPASPLPRGSPFSPPPMMNPRWSPMPSPMSTGSMSLSSQYQGTPTPPMSSGPRPFFRPILPSQSPTPPPSMGMGYQHQQHYHHQAPPPPPPFSPELRPSFDMEFVYPAGMDPGSQARKQAMSIPQESVDEGPSTAQQIASQSQDYVDERLAEYQATIQHLQDEQERVQKKTFVNWINSYLAKHVPPLHIVDLIDDLRDGTKLLALLEVLSGEHLPIERGRNAKRPHFLSNCNSALEFLGRKKIKLVNINSSDIVDGRGVVILGLVWTIILYFQLRCRDPKVIEENTKVLASLGYRFGAPTPTPGSIDRPGSSSSHRQESPKVHGHGRMTPSDRWREGARKALLAWVKEVTHKRFGLEVNDFAHSWRDGNAFLAVINSIRPGLVDMEGLRPASNRTRLETAFRVAEHELGITRLLDPEDVDVPRPDEKSIMTYVAQFLHKSNEPRLQVADSSFSSVQGLYDELLTWLNQKTQYMEHMKQTGALPMAYSQYRAVASEFALKAEPYHRLKTLIESHSQVGISEDAWGQLVSLWKKLESQLKEWEWRLDALLPEPWSGIGQWLAKAELLVTSDDVPVVMDDEAARVLNAKIEDHKAFFARLPDVLSQFTEALDSPVASQVPGEQLQSMATRLQAVGPCAAQRAVKLKFLEHKCCLVAFIVLVENRLKQWTVKYGREEHVKPLLDQYNNFVNRNKIFQEFERAYVDMQHVIEEYKREGGIDNREGRIADHFLWEIGERWKSVSMELRCLQSMLEEVIAYWRRYESVAPQLEDWIDRSLPMVNLPDEEERMEYFQDLGVWAEKYTLLNDTVSFLGATCDPRVVDELKASFGIISAKWEGLFAHVKQYQYAGEMLKMRKDFLHTLSGLQKWLRASEDVLSAPLPLAVEEAKDLQTALQGIMRDIDGMDEEWRVISKKFQSLLPELSGEDVDKLMKTIKKEKECLVRVRGQVPQKLAQIQAILTQQESLEAGMSEISEWCTSAELLMNSHVLSGGPQNAQQLLDKHRQFFAKTLHFKTMLEGKSKVVGGILRTERGPHVDQLAQNMSLLSDQFKRVEAGAAGWESKLSEAIRCWRNFNESRQTVLDWMNTAEKLLQERNLDSTQTVEAHKAYFDQINDRPLRSMMQASKDLQALVSPEEMEHINKTILQLQAKWTKIMAAAPIHLAKLEFRLEEDALASLLKEMDREMANEHQMLNRKDDSSVVFSRHITFFDKGKASPDAKACLEKLSLMESRYTLKHPEDSSLKEQLLQAKAASQTIFERVGHLRILLEEIPAQMNAYRAKYEEVAVWMDSVDVALSTILVACNDVAQFEAEKAKFVEICREVDRRREDMKQLVQMLDTLVSRRADEEALKEQDQLEQLITRYKNLVPTIEATMIKTDVYSRCYCYRQETHRVVSALGKVDDANAPDIQPSSLEEVQHLIGQQQNVLKHLEGQRTTIVSLLQKGKELSKDPHAPPFVPDDVALLDKTWNGTYAAANERLKQLKGIAKVWTEYQSQRDDILALLGQAETELKKIVPRHDAKQVALDLRAKQDMSVSLREATENMLKRLRELAQSLGTTCTSPNELEEEVADLEKRMDSMRTLFDDKVKHLGACSERWNGLNDKMDDMKGWMKGAHRVLAQLLSSDLSPEERLKKSVALQKEIEDRQRMLEALEKEAQDLLRLEAQEAKDANVAPIANQAVLQQVGSLKEELAVLHESVAEQSAATAEALAALEECKAELHEVVPWLEAAEVKVAVGWGKPTVLGDARQLAKQLSEDLIECQAQQEKISEASRHSEKLGSVAMSFDELDIIPTRLANVYNVVAQNKERADGLLRNWEAYEGSFQDFQAWLVKSERSVQKPLDRKSLTIPQLETALAELKALNKEISEHQSSLINVVQECSSVVQHLSPEGASTLNSNLAQLKSRLGVLSNEVRGKMNYLSDSIIARQEFDAKAGDFGRWLSEFGDKQRAWALPLSGLDQGVGEIHSAVQEHAEHLGPFNELEEDAKIYKTAVVSISPEKYNEVGRKLKSRKDLLNDWIALHGWISDANSALDLGGRQINAAGVKKNKIHEIEQAMDKLEEQCGTWLPKAKQLDESCTAVSFSVLDKTSGSPASAERLVLGVKQKLVRTQKDSAEALQRTEKVGSQAEKLKAMDGQIEKYLKDAKAKLASLKPEECSLEACTAYKDALEALIQKHAEMEGLKAKFAALGVELVNADPCLSGEVQSSVSRVEEDYEALSGDLNSKWGSLVDALGLWEGYNESRDTAKSTLQEVERHLLPALKEVPKNASSTARLVEILKKAGDTLSKKKILFENTASLNQQLVSCLAPFVDTHHLSADYASLKASYDKLVTSVATHLPKLETQALLWKTIDGGKEELGAWLEDMKGSLESTQSGLGNSEVARMKLGQYKDELGEKYNAKMSIQAKCAQLKKMNPQASSLPELDEVVNGLDSRFKGLDDLSKALEKTLGSFEDTEADIKASLKDNTEALIRLKETISKCEDRSGTPQDLIARVNVLSKAKLDCDALRPKIAKAEEKALALKKSYPSWDGNSITLNDIKTQVKRLAICDNQANIVRAALVGVLEKNFLEKYTSLAKIVHGLVEKIKWCDPGSINDNFSLESKRSALLEVADGVKDSHEKVGPVQDAFSVLQDIPGPEYAPKLNEHGSTLNKILNDLMIVEKNYKHLQSKFNALAEVWGDFDRDSDLLNAWLKDFENVVKNEALGSVVLEQLPQKLKEAQSLVKDVQANNDKLSALGVIARSIADICPDARTLQIHGHLSHRVQALVKFATGFRDRLLALEAFRKEFQDLLKNTNDHIDASKRSLSDVEKAGNSHQDKLDKVKLILEDKDGLDLLNKTIEAGENLLGGLTSEGKEAIRKELRKLRDKWEGHLDAANALSKKLEALQIQWASFEDNVNQMDGWLKDANSELAKNQSLLHPSLSEKTSALHRQRTLLQDLSSRTEVTSSMKPKLSEFPESSNRVSKLIKEYDSLKTQVQTSVSTLEAYVAHHEKYDFSLEHFGDWVKQLQAELDSASGELLDGETRIHTLDRLQAQLPQGEEDLRKCQEHLQTILPETHDSGRPTCEKQWKDLRDKFQALKSSSKATKEKIEREHGKLSVLQKNLEDLTGWLKHKEAQVKDTSFKSTVETKSAHLLKLETLLGELNGRERDFSKLLADAKDLDNDRVSSASELQNRFSALFPPLNDSITKYKAYLAAHEDFNMDHAVFLKWIEDKKKEAKELGDVVGDVTLLQERRLKLSSIGDERSAKTPEMEALVESGEKLYSHTSADGREIIRLQIRTVRDGWESLGEGIASFLQRLDAGLAQFNDFLTTKEELSKWMEGIEDSLKSSAQLKGTLQEKRAQLQNFKILIQEIASHQPLVDSVTDKAMQVLELSQDSSLQPFASSIKRQFQDIKNKSKDTLSGLEKVVADHASLAEALAGFHDWKNDQVDKFGTLEDLSGEKSEIVRRIEQLNFLKSSSAKGEELLRKVEDKAGSVVLSTSDVGSKAIETEVSAARDAFEKLHGDVELCGGRLNNMLQNWQNFEIGLQNYTKWFREQEAVFRAQVLQNTLEEKAAALQNFTKQRDAVVNFEKEVTGFLDQSHALLQTSNAERIKPLVMQISNRYQLLHVLSKEVVNKWKGIAEDHKGFDSLFMEASNLLDTFETNYKALANETNLDSRNAQLGILAAEKEQLLLKINVLVQLGEKLFPDTGTSGREKIRADLRSLRDRFDLVEQEILGLQKRQTSDSQQWASYQDNLHSTLVWLSNMEGAAAAAMETPNWLSVPDTKSKLMKLKALLQDAISHRRVVEGVIEKAEMLLQKNVAPNPEDIKTSIDDINTRYEALLNHMLLSITSIEETLDWVVGWNDVSKKEGDWQKNYWEQLNLCTDYSGGKPALQSRLARVVELQGGLSEGETLLGTMDATFDSLAEKLPLPSKETLAKDLTNIKFDFDKLKNSMEEVRHSLQERLQQWTEYEDGFERLLLWLSEAEASLKSYSNCNTLEEKEAQQSKYQNLLKTLRDQEASFDKICVESTDLMQLTGESRIASNVEQITSRFQSIQVTAKEILKKSEQAVADHKSYNSKYSKLTEALNDVRTEGAGLRCVEGTSEVLASRLKKVHDLQATRQSNFLALNAVVEEGEQRLLPSTGPDGRTAIRTQLEELQATFDSVYDDLSSLERDIKEKVGRWSGFEESKVKLGQWMDTMEKQMPKELILHATLDEKRGQLDTYRAILHDVLAHQQSVLELQSKAAFLSEGAAEAVTAANTLGERHGALLAKAKDFVEQYEGIVCCHQQYCTALQDTTEWIDGTHSTVLMWSDENQERINLHTNLEKLKNLQMTFPEEEYRIEEIRAVAGKVIPGTVDSAQPNIRSQVDISQQDWEGLKSTVNSCIEGLVQKLKLWNDFEEHKESYMTWLKEVDTKMHELDLQPTLEAKQTQLNLVTSLQGEIKSRELELDGVSDMALNLQRQGMSAKAPNTSSSDIVSKYQQVSHKIKDLFSKWQGYVSSHQDFDSSVSSCQQWLADIKDKLAYCSDLSAYSQKDLETKLGTVHDLLMYKDEGYAKIQNVVEVAQSILANTSPAGHPDINAAVQGVQDEWSTLAARMVDTKNQLDENIHKWAGFLEQIHQLRKTVDYLQSVLKDVVPFQSTFPEKRSQLDTIRNLEEKMVCERLEVESLKLKASEMVASGQQNQAAVQAQEVLKTFDAVGDEIRKLLIDREAQYRDHKVYQESLEEMTGWLQRTRDKIPSFKQRSLSDRLVDVEAAGAMLTSLTNKKPQGTLLIERLTQSGEVARASSSQEGKALIKGEIKGASDAFETLFREIQSQKDGLDGIMAKLRDWKEEHERLSDWLQQCEILIKAAKTTLMGTLEDKKKQVADMHEVMQKLEKGNSQIQKFNEAAEGLLASHLDAYVGAQLRGLNSRYQVQINVGNDVLKKVEANLEQHAQFLANYQNAQGWMENAREVIGECSGHSMSSSSSEARKERLQAALAKIQALVAKQEEGQNLVNATVSWGEKSLRNTRSDGRDRINEQMKEVQSEWERLVKKMTSTKVSLETAMLQWADYNTSYSQVSQWISDREAKLQKVSESKPPSASRKRHPTPGMSSASIGDRKATLRATNTIVQDIVSLEPMIESVTSKAENLMEAPASEISTKYQSLTKQAQEVYARQKEIVEQHQAFVDLAAEFMNWIRAMKERLAKISEPVGDKDILASKISQLKVLQSELPEGQTKLDSALVKGSQACGIVDGEDRELIEEEVAVLQEEFDTFSESLSKTQQLLEVGFVRWREWEDQYKEAEEWLSKTEGQVQTFHKLQNTLTEKKVALEAFQGQLQTIFDWQKDLDKLNLKAQLLLETCADSRVSNAITQMSTKFSALLSLAKEVIRRLELHYQEHQQHSALYQECQDWVDRTREKLAQISDLNYTLSDVLSRLQSIKGLKQTLEQGQNKLRYALELKEKVMLATEPAGAAKIDEDTELLKSEFDRLMQDIQDTRTKLASRASLLEELDKADRLIQDWLAEIELKINVSEGNQYMDLSEKRSSLEKLRGIEKEIGAQTSIQRLENKLAEDPHMPRDPFVHTFVRFEYIQGNLAGHIKRLEGIVREHEDYWKSFNEASDTLRRVKVDLQHFCETPNTKKSDVEQKLADLSKFNDSVSQCEALVKKTKELGQTAMSATSSDGKDAISQECSQLQFEVDSLAALVKEQGRFLKRFLDCWNDFEKAYESTKLLMSGIGVKLKGREGLIPEKAVPEDLDNVKKLLSEVSAIKIPLEDLSDKCETLMEFATMQPVRDRVVQLQSQYSQLISEAQRIVGEVQKSLSDHTGFLKEKEELGAWLQRAEGTLQDCQGFGTEAVIRDKWDLTSKLATRLTEGQHLLSVAQDSFAKAIGVVPMEQQISMREDVSSLQSRWDKLNLDLKNTMSDLKDACYRWESFRDGVSKLGKWCDGMEQHLKESPSVRAELGEMKTLLERYKNFQADLEAQTGEADNLEGEACQLSLWSEDESVKAPVTSLKERLLKFGQTVKERQTTLEKEVQDYSDYHNALQETEKWLLQTSFCLMANNSLYITNREQTLEHLSAHEGLLEEIQLYQDTLEDVKKKGASQISRYIKDHPQIEALIEKQIKNVQDSYDSLWQSGLQIKKRLLESLEKFQEYEDTLDSIMSNLDKWEPEINERLSGPVEDVEASGKRLEYVRGAHNRLQGEKNRLSLAIQACEAATATLSRPASPLDTLQPIPDKELLLRGRLEDLIDKKCTTPTSQALQFSQSLEFRIDGVVKEIQTAMASLSSAAGALEDIKRSKDEISRWVEETSKQLKDIHSRPAKLRHDVGQTEIGVLQDIRQGVSERSLLLATIEASEVDVTPTKYLSNLQSLLDRLDAETAKVIGGKMDIQAKIEDYRKHVSGAQAWLEAIAKKLDPLEKGGGLTLIDKKAIATQIVQELEAGSERIRGVKQIAEAIIPSLSNVDAQLVEETLKGVDRRYNEMKKRVARKVIILDTTLKSFSDFTLDSEQVHSDIQKKLQESDAKRGYAIALLEDHHSSLKAALKEIEGKQTILDTLDRRLTSLQPELEDGEVAEAEAKLAAMMKLHAEACDTLRKRLREIVEELGDKRKFIDKLERARSWVNKMEGEVEDLGNIPLGSTEVSKKIDLLKKHQVAVKDFSDGPLSEIRREADGLSKECDSRQQSELTSIVTGLEESKDHLHSGMEDLIHKLRKALGEREDFEAVYVKCTAWVQEAEIALGASDLKGSTNLHVLEEQGAKYRKLLEEAVSLAPSVSDLGVKAKALSPSLKEPERHIIGEKVSSLTSKVASLSSSLKDKLDGVTAAIAEFHTFSNVIEDAIKYTNSVKDKISVLSRPIGSAIEDSQGLLASYEELLSGLKAYRNKLDALNRPSFKRTSELLSVMKDQDDLVTSIESQIQRLRHLLLLQQQYLALTTEISNFILKYNEIVPDVERNKNSSVEDKIKRYADIFGRIQETEAQLSSAMDKGERIAEEGTVSDRNSITEELQSLKQSLHNLRRLVEGKRAEHELAFAEHKKYMEELDGLIALLHEKETLIRSRPLLGKASSSLNAELRKHEELASDVNDKLLQISGIQEMLTTDSDSDSELPPSLVEKLNQTRLILRTFPSELEDRRKYLEDNKGLRSTYEGAVSNIETWMRESSKRLQGGEGGLDVDNLIATLTAHKNFFGNEKAILGPVQSMKAQVDKMWPTLLPAEQEGLRKEQDGLNEKVQNTLNSAKNYYTRLEQSAILWKTYKELLDIVQDVIGRAEAPSEPSTTLSSLKANLGGVQAKHSALLNQQQELDNLNERAKSVEGIADGSSRSRIKAQMESINSRWMVAIADLDSRKDALLNLVTQWEQCETLWQAFEGGLSTIEEQFSQIDPSIRSQAQLQETKETIASILTRAKGLGATHKELLHYAQYILSHLQHTSDICYSTLKSKLEHLTRQYTTILQLLEEKLDWLNNQDAFLSELDKTIEALQKELKILGGAVEGINPYDADSVAVVTKLEVMSQKARQTSDGINTFGAKVKEKFASLKQVLPTSIGKSISNLEVDIESLISKIEDAQQNVKKGAGLRVEFRNDLEKVKQWIGSAEGRLQARSQEPHLMKETLQSLASELPNVCDTFEKCQRNGSIIMERSVNDKEREDVASALQTTEAQLQNLKALIDERRLKVSESLDSWQRFLQLHGQSTNWCEEKRSLLTEPLFITSLPDTRVKVNVYDVATKTLKTVNKYLSEMAKEIGRVAETSSAAPLTEMFEEVEKRKIDIEASLLERHGLLQETLEEWEQCERKLKEAQSWLEKARQAVENPAGKRKPLRDQLTVRDKILADVVVMRTKVTLAVEKLQVHFKAGIGGDPNVAKDASDLQTILNAFETEVKAQCTTLETAVTEIDKLQEELQQLRSELNNAEQTLRNVANATYSQDKDKERAAAEQKNAKERVKGIQSKITARSERIKLLLLRP